MAKRKKDKGVTLSEEQMRVFAQVQGEVQSAEAALGQARRQRELVLMAFGVDPSRPLHFDPDSREFSYAEEPEGE